MGQAPAPVPAAPQPGIPSIVAPGAPAPQPGAIAPKPMSAADEARAAAIRRMLQSRTNIPSTSANPAGAPSSGATRQGLGQPAVRPPAQMQTTNGDTIVITPPPSAKTSADDLIPAGLIDFRNAELSLVLQVYAELVNRTILRPANLGAANQIFLKTQTELTRKEAIQALEAVLGMNGLAFVNMGDKFVKAVPVANAGQAGAAINTNKAAALPEMGSYVTHVVQLAYTKPSEMVQVLQPFASAIPNPILPIDSSQILVLRDYSENVKRMLEMIEKIDVSVPSEFISEVIPIKYAKATEIASALNSLSSGGGSTSVGAGGGGSGAASTGTRGVQRTVGGMGGMGGSSYNRGGYGGGGYGGYTPYAAPAAPFGTSASAPATAAPGTSFTDRLRNIINKASSSGEISVLGQTKMIADERTNSLLIYASREDMKIIKEIVAKLDVVLAQVLIEAVIVEVTLGDQQDIGFSYLQRPQSSGGVTGAGAINNTSGFRGINDFISGSTNGIAGGFSYLLQVNDDFDVFVRAVANDNKARIVQRPRIQTSHNEPASLFVGESVPYPTGSYYGGGAYGGYSSIQQLPIGVTLTVTPLINPDGLVVMDISQDIQSVNGFVNIDNVGDVPITSQKSAQAKVSVRDGDSIILGGLIENSKSRTRSGVPLLMDIPVLGFFFSSNSNKDKRNELIVMIRPTVLPTPEIAALTAKKERQSMPLVGQAEHEVFQEEAAQAHRNLRPDPTAKGGTSYVEPKQSPGDQKPPSTVQVHEWHETTPDSKKAESFDENVKPPQ